MKTMLLSKRWRWMMLIVVCAFLLSACPGKKTEPMKQSSSQKMQKRSY